MIDIVERLRFDAARCEVAYSKGIASNIEEAAKEIERLRIASAATPLDSTDTQPRINTEDTRLRITREYRNAVCAFLTSCSNPGGYDLAIKCDSYQKMIQAQYAIDEVLSTVTRSEPAPSFDKTSEPVAWRWRYTNFPGEMGWILVPTKPGGDGIDVEPLYAAPTSFDRTEHMIVKVNLEYREDGGVHVWSDELPGLILSGKDRTRVIADIEPAVRALLKYKGVEPKHLRIDATLIPPADRGEV